MFDYMIKILPNGRILVRNTAYKTSKVLRPDQVSSYFENALEEQFKAQKAEDDKIEEIREQVQK